MISFCFGLTSNMASSTLELRGLEVLEEHVLLDRLCERLHDCSVLRDDRERLTVVQLVGVHDVGRHGATPRGPPRRWGHVVLLLLVRRAWAVSTERGAATTLPLLQELDHVRENIVRGLLAEINDNVLEDILDPLLLQVRLQLFFHLFADLHL